jgi:hypothetical protein
MEDNDVVVAFRGHRSSRSGVSQRTKPPSILLFWAINAVILRKASVVDWLLLVVLITRYYDL